MKIKHARYLSAVVLALAAVWAIPAAADAGAGAAAAPDEDLTGQPELFVTADRCIGCHNGVSSPTGEDISIGAHWRSSMMANSSRDPYWQAAVRRETIMHPTASSAIQHECSACHMPMMRYHAKLAGGHGGVFANLPVNGQQSPRGMLAVDGVSCTLCHQVTPEGFGGKESFTAGFCIDNDRPFGERVINGPFEAEPGRRQLMHSASFYHHEKAGHVQESELCATCHTLYTHALDEKGNVVGELPEQVPYLEWKHSAYAGEQSCQSCHMPEVPGKAMVSGVLGQEHENVSKHSFRGGNFFMPQIFNTYRADLGVKALPGELAATSAAATENLATASAKLGLENVELDGGSLRAEVRVANLAGHKLPSAYPSRRAWLHLTVRDGNGDLLFESGALNADGSIKGNDNDTDAAAYEPHYELISDAGQVQVYEPILGDHRGAVTTSLISGVSYLKDNRLLPTGFNKATAHDDIAAYGGASDDGDFIGGFDRVVYEVALDTAGPLTVSAELWYQPIGYRWAHNLADTDSAETDRFVGYYEAQAANSAALLARDTVVVK